MFPPGVDPSPAVGPSVDADNVREVQKHISKSLHPLSGLFLWEAAWRQIVGAVGLMGMAAENRRCKGPEARVHGSQ